MEIAKKRRNLGLPLLMKELHEQSARMRTFVIRVIYAVLFVVAVGLFNADRLSELASTQFLPGSTLGAGQRIFRSILGLQFAGVYLFLPAIACGVLTVEKERNTLGLLLITKLTPWTIVLEKFASRIIPMLTIMLTSLPLISFSYSLGGIETSTLWIGLWFLFLSIIQVASFSVLASSFFAGTVGSFLGTYALLAVATFGLPLLDWLVFNEAIRRLGVNIAGAILFPTNSNLGYLGGEMTIAMFVPPALYQMHVLSTESMQMYGLGVTSGQALSQTLGIAFYFGLPTLLSVAINLSLARFFLVRRAFVTTTNPILSLFKMMDRIFVRANNFFCRGAVLIKESQSLPDMNPVAWRETVKRSLGQFRYLVRVFAVLEFPTVFLIYIAAMGPRGDSASSEPVSALMFLLWIVSVVLISVTSSNLVAGERSRQTLDVLLTTPLASQQIILEKLRGTRRLMLVCAVPLLTCIVFQTWWRVQLDRFAYGNYGQPISGSGASSFDWLEYLVTSVSGVIVLFHLMMWVSFWVGLRKKSTSKAILTSMAVVVAWCVLPLMLMLAAMIWLYYPYPPGYRSLPNGTSSGESEILVWFLVSPAFLVVFSEFDSLRKLHTVPYMPVIINTVIYGGFWAWFRYRVLSRADQGLVRIQARFSPHSESRVRDVTSAGPHDIPPETGAEPASVD